MQDRPSDTKIPLEGTAEYFNSFSANVGSKLAKGFPDRWKYYGDQNPNLIDPITTSTDEVIRFCREIDVMKSSGMDRLPSRICKDAFLALSEQLVHICLTVLSGWLFFLRNGRLQK